MDFHSKATRGSRGGAGPSGFREYYTGPGASPSRPKARQAAKAKPCGHKPWEGCFCEELGLAALRRTWLVWDSESCRTAEGEQAVAA